ncbi:MAG: alpha-E domain-containing protein, partial [Sphingobium sp.]
ATPACRPPRSGRWRCAWSRSASTTDFLMLNTLFPRSVAFCYGQLSYRLGRLAGWHDARGACHDTIEQMVTEQESLDSGEIFRRGLHETVQHGLKMTNQLGFEIAQTYHFG